jgi:anhydro-N-acetylmuramic acid kinase
MNHEYYIGIMSGTSIDAIDAALVDFKSHPPQLVASHTKLFPENLRDELNALCSPGADEINRLGAADHQLGKLFATTVKELLTSAKIAANQIKAIGSHGQTIRHQPQGLYPFTLQIGDPNIIAEETQIKTVADFRKRDLACGGQGAPLTPAFHDYLFRHDHKNRVILNLGGIANITFLSSDIQTAVIGFDTGPANTLLDNWIKKNKQKNYDENGTWAASGKINSALLDILLEDSYFKQSSPKSTGREYFNLTWLENYLQQLNSKLSPEDIQATLCELTVMTIMNDIRKVMPFPGEILVCGGGIKNQYLIERLKFHASDYTLHSTKEFGVPSEWIEAMAFAWLARQTLHEKSGNIPSVTGAKKNTILGGIYN